MYVCVKKFKKNISAIYLSIKIWVVERFTAGWVGIVEKVVCYLYVCELVFDKSW